MFNIPLPSIFKTYILPEEENYYEEKEESQESYEESVQDENIDKNFISEVISKLDNIYLGMHVYYFYSMLQDVTPMYFSVPYYLSISNIPVCILHESEDKNLIKYLTLPDSFKGLSNVVNVKNDTPLLTFYTNADSDSLSTYINAMIMKGLGGSESDDFIINSYSMDYLFSSVHGDKPFIVISKRVFDVVYEIVNKKYKFLYNRFNEEDTNKYKIDLKKFYDSIKNIFESESSFHYPVESLFSFLSSIYKEDIHNIRYGSEESYESSDVSEDAQESEEKDEDNIKITDTQRYYISLLLFQKYDVYFNNITNLNYDLEEDIFYLSVIKLIRQAESEQDFKNRLIHYLCIYISLIHPIAKSSIDTFELDSDCRLEIENKSNVLFGYEPNFVEGSYKYDIKDLEEKYRIYKRYINLVKDTECYEEMSMLDKDKNIIKSYSKDVDLHNAIYSALNPNLFAIYRAKNSVSLNLYFDKSVYLFDSIISKIRSTDEHMSNILTYMFKSHPIFNKMIDNAEDISDCEKNYYRALLYYAYFVCKKFGK